jgi:hypothetical protein
MKVYLVYMLWDIQWGLVPVWMSIFEPRIRNWKHPRSNSPVWVVTELALGNRV